MVDEEEEEAKEAKEAYQDEDKKFKEWAKINKPVHGRYYWIKIKNWQTRTIGQYCKWGMDLGERCFSIIGWTTPISYRDVKIVKMVQR